MENLSKILSVLALALFSASNGFIMGLSSSTILTVISFSVYSIILLHMIIELLTNVEESKVKETILSGFKAIMIISLMIIGAITGIRERQKYEANEKSLQFDKEVTLKKKDNELKKDVMLYEFNLKNSIDTLSFDEVTDLKK